MATNVYTPPEGSIIHITNVDFTYRTVGQPIHVVQYDKQLPIAAVYLHVSGKPYSLPSTMDARVRWGKRDHTYVYKSVLGCNEERNVVYFDIDEQMTFLEGPVDPIIELMIPDAEDSYHKAGSSSIPVIIDRNPIQDGDIESKSDYKVIEDAIAGLELVENETKAARDEAVAAAESTEGAVETATTARDEAVAAANSIGDSVSQAQAARDDAISAKNDAESARDTILNAKLNANIPVQASTSDFARGTLIRTSIPFGDSSTNGMSWKAVVRGKAYSGIHGTINFILEGYQYGGNIVSFKGVNYTGNEITGIKAGSFPDDSTLFIWIPRLGYWNSYQIEIYNTNLASAANTPGLPNLCTNIVNADLPAVTPLFDPIEFLTMATTADVNYVQTFNMSNKLEGIQQGEDLNDYINLGIWYWQRGNFTTPNPHEPVSNGYGVFEVSRGGGFLIQRLTMHSGGGGIIYIRTCYAPSNEWTGWTVYNNANIPKYTISGNTLTINWT